jgi:hypothetical protein
MSLSCNAAREMVAFEWLHRAATDEFRTVHREFLR